MNMMTLIYAECIADVLGHVSENQCEFCFQHFDSLNERKTHEVEHKSEERPFRFVSMAPEISLPALKNEN